MLDGGAVDFLVARIFHDIKQEKKNSQEIESVMCCVRKCKM